MRIVEILVGVNALAGIIAFVTASRFLRKSRQKASDAWDKFAGDTSGSTPPPEPKQGKPL